MTAVAIATLRLSDVGSSGGNEGIRKECVISWRTAVDMPFPSLPITIIPDCLEGIASGVYMFL